MREPELKIALAGNPNCGKTTLFNAFTGARLKAANFPGVTVEIKEREFEACEKTVRLFDLPGTYSLDAASEEERLACDFISGKVGGADVIINVADASCLERSLYLTLQLLEINIPTVLCLNMTDIVKRRGMHLDCEKLGGLLGIAAVPVCARRREGLKELIAAAVSAAGSGRHDSAKSLCRIYSSVGCGTKTDPAAENMRRRGGHETKRDRASNGIWRRGGYETKRDPAADDIGRYAAAKKLAALCCPDCGRVSRVTDKVDAVFTHRFFGFPILVLVGALVLFASFATGDFLAKYTDGAMLYISSSAEMLLSGVGAAPWLVSLFVDGILGGFSSVVSFLPNIAVLFFLLGMLEDSGYMARAAYNADGIMRHVGLSGKAFIPMLLGFGCSVPAVMAARTLEGKKERFAAVMSVPFVACSARLPVCLMLAKTFFFANPAAAAVAAYFASVTVAMLCAALLSRSGRREKRMFILELPDYKMPSLRTVFAYTFDKSKEYLKRAGTVIVLASAAVWALCGTYGARCPGEALGRMIAPLYFPCGFGTWQLALALISGIAAKEVVVSSLAVLYSCRSAAEVGAALYASGFTTANAASLMVFVLLYTPCAAALAAIRRETGSRAAALLSAAGQFLAAWLVSAAVYGVCRLVM